MIDKSIAEVVGYLGRYGNVQQSFFCEPESGEEKVLLTLELLKENALEIMQKIEDEYWWKKEEELCSKVVLTFTYK